MEGGIKEIILTPAGNIEQMGANCAYQPKLQDLPLEELLRIYQAAKKQEKIIGAEVRRRIYNIEKRK